MASAHLAPAAEPSKADLVGREETSGSPQLAAKSASLTNCNAKEQPDLTAAANNNNNNNNNTNNNNNNNDDHDHDNAALVDQQISPAIKSADCSQQQQNGTSSPHSSGVDSTARLGDGQHTVIECSSDAQVTSTPASNLAQVQLAGLQSAKLEDSDRELKFVTKFESCDSSQVKGSSSSEVVQETSKLATEKKARRRSAPADPEQPFCPAQVKQQRLSYLQTLLLRKWPCLAITICIMSSLMFGILLSALTIYLMHGASECSLLAARVAAVTGSHSPLLARGDLGAVSSLDLADAGLASLTGESQLLDPPGQVGSAAAASSPSAAQLSQKTQFQRLPSTVWPVHYDLFVWPHIAEPNFNFSGQVSIRIKCQEATDNITLHSLDLDIEAKSVQLKRISPNETAALKSSPKVRALNQDKQLQYFIVQLDGKLEPGAEYALEMDFSGQLNEDLAGFYKIKYEQKNSTEPTSEDKLWVTDTFAKSHRMSTYLVAYAVTNFQSRSKGNISVWTRPGFAHTAEYALEIAGKILRYYEQFFGIEYPLPKMDMIALPDFNAGAMENWGLITYRETAMLYDETSSSVANKQRVAVVVAHELAHQWFGNLVTPKWWDDLWLNEGFASYVEYIGVDHVEPSWRMLDQFVVEEVQDVFKVDGLSSSHQISIPVNNPDEISEIFDHISYAKGASIIRMMNHFLTESVFKSGLRSYLRALRYSNAEQSDLWAHLTRAQQLQLNETSKSTAQSVDVGQVMNSWTLQTGYPLVTLSRNYGESGRQVRAKLSQARYQPYKRDQPQQVNHTDSVQRWEIPVTFTWKSEQNWQPRTRLWLHQNQSQSVELRADELDLPKSDEEWWILNVQQVGYYRVNYDQRNWRLLIDQLNQDHTKISMTNRAQILDDIFELARSAVIDYRFAMEATRYLRSERDYLPWDTVLMSFAYIDEMLQRTPIYGDWEAYLGELIAPYYARYKDSDWMIANPQLSKSNISSLALRDKQPATLDPNDILEQYNQVNAIAWACTVDKHCIQKARSMFQQWRSTGKNLINPALRYTTYCTSIKNGDKSDWEFLWRAYEKEQNASERDRIMRALGCSKEIWILARYLEWTFSKTKPIRRQDGAFVFRMIAKNNYGRDIAFNFMRERWSTIKDYYGKTSFSLGSLIRSVSTSMNTQIELQQLLNFYESIKGDVGTGKRSFQIAIEEVESNVAWRNRNYKIIEDWLQSERAGAAKIVS